MHWRNLLSRIKFASEDILIAVGLTERSNKLINFPDISRACTTVQHTVVNTIAVSFGRHPTLTLSPKPLNRSTQIFAWLPWSARSWDVPKIIAVGCTGAPHAYTYAKYNVFMCLFFRVLRLAHRRNGELHEGLWRLKRRASGAGRAFFGTVDDVSPE